MNYGDWVKAFENMTSGQLRDIVNALDTLEKNVYIKREFDDMGLFGGFSIRSAAKEVLRKQEEEFTKQVAQRAYTMAVTRIVEEYSQVNPAVITCPVTFRKVQEWIQGIKTNDSILDVVGAIIDVVIDDTHLYYPDLKSKFIKEAGLDMGADESECSILYGESYYSLEDSIVEVLAIAYQKTDMALTYDSQEQTTPYFWDCNCGSKFIHQKDKKVCFDCNAVASGQPNSRVGEVVNARLRGVL